MRWRVWSLIVMACSIVVVVVVMVVVVAVVVVVVVMGMVTLRTSAIENIPETWTSLRYDKLDHIMNGS